MSDFNLGRWELRRAGARVEPQKKVEPTKRPPTRRGLFVIAVGNSGEEVGLRMQELAWRDGFDIPICFLNNDAKMPNAIAVRLPDGQTHVLRAEMRLVVGGEGNTRDQIQDYPLLAQRYSPHTLLRNIPVYQTYNRGGRGGHAMPVISAMDLDLHIDEVYGFLRKGLSWLRDGATRGDAPARSDLERILKERTRKQQATAQAWIVAQVGGASGSFGNASHQLLPHLTREILKELGIKSYELWGFLLGPKAFTGLTDETQRNYYALLNSLDYMARHGLQRQFINGMNINTATPSYDRIFLLDDVLLPRAQAYVTESELHTFFQRAALSAHLLLSTEAWEVIASHHANPTRDQSNQPDARLRMWNTVNGALAGADHDALAELVALTQQTQLLDALVMQLK
ncbi:MAG: hypothetical protein HY741_30000 [Chloroflexi bacterium]|nr:hypothetical protein [Chloroflexota bacterium]